MWEKWSLYREKVGRVEGKNLNFLQKVEGMCGAWIHTPQTCLGSHMCGVWIHTPQRKPMRHKKFKFKFVCHVCVKFVTHKHVHAPQRKSIPVCVTFGEVIRDKQSWFCHSCPMRHIPHVTSLLFSCSVKPYKHISLSLLLISYFLIIDKYYEVNLGKSWKKFKKWYYVYE